jgi:hypothetical protein
MSFHSFAQRANSLLTAALWLFDVGFPLHARCFRFGGLSGVFVCFNKLDYKLSQIIAVEIQT